MNDRELHVRELARRAGHHEASIRQELKKLKRLDLISGRRDGNRVYFRANTAHPLYPEIHRLVIKTSGLVEVLFDAMSDSDIDVAFIFGSVAQGREVAMSDIDLMVIGDVRLRKLTALLSGVAESVGREVNPHIMTAKEFRERHRSTDYFVTQVLSGSKLFVIGKEDDLNAMAQ